MTATFDHPNLQFWTKELDSGVPWRAAEAAKNIADAFSSSNTDVKVTVCDAFWNEIGPAGNYIEVSGTIPRNAAPQATLKLPENHWLDPYLSQCENTMVGVIIETDGISEAFYVKRHREKLDEDGKVTLTSELVGIWDILNYLPIWPSWYLPIATQPFSHAIYFSPLCSVIEAMAAQQSFRIQSGLNEFLNNALSLNPDVRTYIGTMLQAIKNDPQTGSVLKTPLYVVRTGVLTDSSPLFCRTVRMETVGQVIADITKAYGVDVRVYLWRPGMEQPDKYANLTHPTYVMTVKDRSQIEGPTKTALDSALRFLVDTQGSLLGKTLDPLLNPDGEYAPEGVYIAPALGLVFVPPYAQLETPDTIVADGEVIRSKSALMTYEIVRSTPLGWQHIIGGKSPKWLNDLMNAFYSFVIDAAQIILGFTGVPSNLLDGFLNDAFFAFQLIQHYSRRDDVGPYHPAIEVFTPTNSSPYNIEALFQLIQVLWDSRGYTTAVATFRGQNGPFKLGRDIFPGALMSLVYASRTKVFTDHIELVSFKSARGVRELTVQIGDGKPIQHPIVELKRNVSEVIAAVNVATLAPSS
ncbi:Gp37-like protein [Mycolicibacterium austroafricanum]|uniref:Gp37-like protein n=1 Tax=Mycolicibacterium austroafricanum TaxID=39687 RepID=UPI001ABF1ECC|nr:hypothetical protein [Mycolicibacterium austroafricanum]QRZ05885.1 hypothetical protein JN090_23645 [Mycolicibacterium austroafricanum]